MLLPDLLGGEPGEIGGELGEGEVGGEAAREARSDRAVLGTANLRDGLRPAGMPVTPWAATDREGAVSGRSW